MRTRTAQLWKLITEYLGYSVSVILAVALIWPGTAIGQALPTLIINDANVFEGNSGTKIMSLPVSFVGAQNTTVTGVVSAVSMSSGVGFNPATGGSSCSGSVDFVQFTDVPFSIPPNTPNGTLSVNITICGNSTIEPNEHIFVSMTVFSGATCLEGTCTALGTILDDDGPVTISINDISVSEPVLRGDTRTTAFTVSLNHPSTLSTSVNFSTSNGTATAGGTFPDYQTTSGTLTIPPNTLTGTINVTIVGDQIQESNQTFFVNLSNAVNATISDTQGRATIRDTTLSIGDFDLSPDDAIAREGDIIDYAVTWIVPDGRVWRDLKTLDFRLRQGNNIALWIRWDELSNTFSLCDVSIKKSKGRRGGGLPGSEIVCGAGELPGSSVVLEGALGQLHLAETTVIGSGPTGQSVTLNLPIELGPNATGHYAVELAATDDFGAADDFVQASDVLIRPASKR
jgi:Calx-beta domain